MTQFTTRIILTHLAQTFTYLRLQGRASSHPVCAVYIVAAYNFSAMGL